MHVAEQEAVAMAGTTLAEDNFEHEGTNLSSSVKLIVSTNSSYWFFLPRT
jgi:hypothetical protein